MADQELRLEDEFAKAAAKSADAEGGDQDSKIFNDMMLRFKQDFILPFIYSMIFDLLFKKLENMTE